MLKKQELGMNQERRPLHKHKLSITGLSTSTSGYLKLLCCSNIMCICAPEPSLLKKGCQVVSQVRPASNVLLNSLLIW
jgi:hypothetical protein